MPTQDPTTLAYRMDRVEKEVEKIKEDDTRTKLAVVVIELAGLQSEYRQVRAEVNDLKTKVGTSEGFWSGSRNTIVLSVMVLGLITTVILGVVNALGG